MRFYEMESESEKKAKEKRLIELERLIAESKETLERMKSLDGPLTNKKRQEDHRYLLMEKDWYARGHSFNSWKEFLAKDRERQNKERAIAAEQAKTAAEQKAADDKKLAEREQKLREEFELERDEFLAWKRSKTTRTF